MVQKLQQAGPDGEGKSAIQTGVVPTPFCNRLADPDEWITAIRRKLAPKGARSRRRARGHGRIEMPDQNGPNAVEMDPDSAGNHHRAGRGIDRTQRDLHVDRLELPDGKSARGTRAGQRGPDDHHRPVATARSERDERAERMESRESWKPMQRGPRTTAGPGAKPAAPLLRWRRC